MFSSEDIMDMIFPKWLRVTIVLILVFAIIGGINVLGNIINMFK